MIRSLLKLSRPKHWLKNILVFIPIIYAQKIFDIEMLFSNFLAFIAFCLISSAVYVINDLADAEKDKLHPIKHMRPIAAGLIGKRQAVIFAVLLLIGGFVLFCNIYLFLYVLLNLAYSFKLKHIVLIDCFCIAGGFMLRILAGGAAGDAVISEWLFLTMITASLFMAFGKRRGEILHTASESRKVLASYNEDYLHGMIFVCSGLSIVFYSLWSMTVSYMIYTVPLVIYIIAKYLLVCHDTASHGDPISIILADKVLIIAIGGLGLLSIVLLY